LAVDEEKVQTCAAQSQKIVVTKAVKFQVQRKKISVADPNPGSDAFLTLDPGSGMGKKF
jgi:hypothetical protein